VTAAAASAETPPTNSAMYGQFFICPCHIPTARYHAAAVTDSVVHGRS
jgi:hypothetical protein